MSDLINEIKNTFEENKGSIYFSKSIGVDGINGKVFISQIDNGDEANTIIRKIQNKSYKFSNYKENLIIKEHDKTRQISIPTQRDKLILKALLKILKKDFLIFGSSAKNKVIDIKKNIGNFDSFIKIDIVNFYPSINQKKLLEIISKKSTDKVFNLIKLAISQPTVPIDKPRKNRGKLTNSKGIPQGLPISSFLADIFLEEIDKKYESKPNIKYYRFVDDILILCNTNEVNNLLYDLETKFNNLDLKIHTQNENKDKSSNGRVKDGFQYLGYSFSDRKVSVRQSSVQRIYDKINKLFISFGHKKNSKNANHASVLEDLIYSLNEKIAGAKYQDKKYGWINYFSEIDDHTLLFKLDSHVKKMSKKYLNEKDFKYLKNSGLKIKKFSKAFFEIKNINSNYIERPESNNINRLIRLLLSDQKDLKNKVGDVNNKITNKENNTSKKAINKKNLNIEKPHREPELVIKSLISDVEPYQ